MKKTFRIVIENANILIALMEDLGFQEIDRVATGGMMSTPELLITFEGVESDYHENGYIAVPEGQMGCRYYSLRKLGGYLTQSIEMFISLHKSSEPSTIKVERLP